MFKKVLLFVVSSLFLFSCSQKWEVIIKEESTNVSIEKENPIIEKVEEKWLWKTWDKSTTTSVWNGFKN